MKNRKILKLIIVCFLLVVFCTACNGDVTREIRHAGFSISGTFTCDRFYPKDKEDTSYDRIRYFTSTHLINDDGKIFELSLSQPFTNNQNCREASTDLVVKAILNNSIIKATNNKYYYLNAQNNIPSYTEVPETDNNYYIYNLLLKDEDVVKVMTANSSTGLYYVLKNDGNVYGIVITQIDRNSLPVITSTQVVYNYNHYGSRIVDFSYAGDSLNTYLKTEDRIYRMRITNASECSKYADIVCEYSLEQDPVFEKYHDRIIAYNGSILITDYKQTFQVNS